MLFQTVYYAVPGLRLCAYTVLLVLYCCLACSVLLRFILVVLRRWTVLQCNQLCFSMSSPSYRICHTMLMHMRLQQHGFYTYTHRYIHEFMRTYIYRPIHRCIRTYMHAYLNTSLSIFVTPLCPRLQENTRPQESSCDVSQGGHDGMTSVQESFTGPF